MTKEDIIRMANDVGIKGPAPARQGFKMYASSLKIRRFAALVAAAEREACARLCDQMFHDWCNQEFEDEDEAYRNKPDAEDCKKAIRERGNT